MRTLQKSRSRQLIASLARYPARTLPLLWLLGAALRIALAYLTTREPVIMPDSALYMHLASSIWKDGALLLRGQPIKYAYILYPLLIAPLNALPAHFDIYRAVQAFNALCMSAAIFPAYALGKALGKKNTYGWLVAGLTLLVPDAVMTLHPMVESVSYPLILCACYCMLRALREKESLRWQILTVVLCVLLYALKPGYIAIGLLFLLVLIARCAREHTKAAFQRTLLVILVMLSAFLAYWLLLYRLGYMAQIVSLYESQTAPLTLAHLLQALNGLWAYAVYVPLAFAIYPLFFPIAHASVLEKDDRTFLFIVLLSMLCIVVGSAYVIYVDELADANVGTRVHVRYIAAFLPVLIALCYQPALKGKKLDKSLVAMLGFSLLTLSRMPVEALEARLVDAPLLSPFMYKGTLVDLRLMWMAVLGTASLVYAFLLMKDGYGPSLVRALSIGLAAMFIIGNASTYRQISENIREGWREEARELFSHFDANEHENESPPWAVVGDGRYFWPQSIAVDLESSFTAPVLEMEDLIENLTTDGIIQPFVPRSYWMTSGVHALSTPPWILLDAELLNTVVLAQGIQTVSSTWQVYAAANVPEDAPFLHSALTGLDEGWMDENSRFVLFDPTLRQKETVTLSLQMRAGMDAAELQLVCGSQTLDYALDDTLAWHTFTLENKHPEAPFVVQLEALSGDIYIASYLIE